MKLKKILSIIYILISLNQLEAQNGLERIIVEKYYISNENDTSASAFGGSLPIGSVTYRIYLDMLPEYRFYAAYGKEDHELKFETSTLFFNNEDMGNITPNVIPLRTLKRNTVMLDSWLSAGGASESSYGVLKENDNVIETISHEKLFLKNTDPEAGIALTERDGILIREEIPTPALFGLDSISKVFFNSTKGNLFITKNGAWGCLGGAVGLDSLGNNHLLIAQVTTDGDFSFELNVQIGKRKFPLEYYVAKNPVENEISLPSLTYTNKKARKTPFSETKKTNNKRKE